MAAVIVERCFEAPVDLQAQQALEDAVDWCLRQHGVTFLHGYVSRDPKHAVCLYQGPDAEAVRLTQRQGGLPFDHVWPATALVGPTLAAVTQIDDDGQTIVAQQQLLDTRDRTGLAEALPRGAQRRGAALVESFLARGTGRMICRFRAPDVQTVRALSAEARVPMIRGWPAFSGAPEAGSAAVGT